VIEMKPGTRILLVEDDQAITSFVGPQLKHRNLSVRCAYDGEEALAQIEQFRPELVVLDIMLPKFDGVGVLNRIRHSGNRVPVIMLTARDTTLDKVHTLQLGADDYLTKPFDIKELVARMQALLRRVHGDEILRVGDLEVDTATREVRRGEREIELTYRECDGVLYTPYVRSLQPQ
jgi:DNA-binding response OmpR family regulator